MNSKVKQAQKDGAAIGDIAAGLAISVVKNALYKVIRLRDAASLVIPSSCRAAPSTAMLFCVLWTADRQRSHQTGYCRADGWRLALRCWRTTAVRKNRTLVDATTLSAFDYRSKSYRCGGCGNNCLVTAHYFPAGVFHTGNRCRAVRGCQ